MKRIAAAVVEDPSQQIYLQLRDNIAGIGHPDHWGLFGGTIEVAEAPVDAIIRELKEELAITVDRTRLSLLGCYPETPSKHIYAFCYRSIDEMQTAILGEGQRIGRFTRSELAGLSIPLLETHSIIPIVWQILQVYLQDGAKTRFLQILNHE